MFFRTELYGLTLLTDNIFIAKRFYGHFGTFFELFQDLNDSV